MGAGWRPSIGGTVIFWPRLSLFTLLLGIALIVVGVFARGVDNLIVWMVVLGCLLAVAPAVVQIYTASNGYEKLHAGTYGQSVPLRLDPSQRVFGGGEAQYAVFATSSGNVLPVLSVPQTELSPLTVTL